MSEKSSKNKRSRSEEQEQEQGNGKEPEKEASSGMAAEEFAKRLADRKKKRQKKQQAKSDLLAGPGLGDKLESETAGSAASWLGNLERKKKSNGKKKKKRKRGVDLAAALDNQDEEFAQADYQAKDLEGLRVMHDVGDLQAGEQMILTLEDANVLDEGEQRLVSSKLKERENTKKFAEYRTNKGKPVYNVYDHDDTMLGQYDEKQKTSFVLGAKGVDEDAKQRLEELKKKAAVEAARLLYSANASSAPNVAAEFMTKEEMRSMRANAGKKSKKKKKKKKKEKSHKGKRRKKTTSELVSELGLMDEDDNKEDRASKSIAKERRKAQTEEGRKQELMAKEARYRKALQDAMRKSKKQIYGKNPDSEVDDMAQEEEDEELRAALVAKRDKRKMDIKKEGGVQMSVEERLAQRAKKRKERETARKEEAAESGGLVFTTTTEFVKAVSVKEEEVPEVKKEKAEEKQVPQESQKPAAGGWAAGEDVEMGEIIMYDDDAKATEEKEKEKELEGLIGEEPSVGTGLAATLNYLRMRGADTQQDEVVSRLTDGSVSKHRKLYLNPEDDPAPHIDLQKYDEFGRPVSQKEAFRMMSQGFHGNKAGPMAQERRLRAYMRELKMKEKLTSQSALSDLDKVEKRQKETGSAAIKLTIGTSELEDLQDSAKEAVKRKLQKMNRKKR